MEKQTAYLLGLMCGRGHIIEKDKKVIIEFAHKNKVILGIAYCSHCGGLATKKEESDSETLTCKECNRSVLNSVKKVYEQRDSTIKSLINIIIPFLSKEFKINYDFVGNDHMTLLILDFLNQQEKFNNILKLFDGKLSFDSFVIPKEIKNSVKENKIEFVNGLLDTSGFFNSGSWYMRQNASGEEIYVMRGYFQIINRNWKMPIEILDFLNNEFSLTLQTIDWGHPNNRDQSNIYAWTREHQLKFFPEDYTLFSLRLIHKQEMFKELMIHNKNLGVYTKDIYGISPINKGQIKPYHPAENDLRLPLEIRKKHFDASWQIALRLGSELIKKQFDKCNYKKIVYLTGKDKSLNLDEISKVYEEIRKEKTKKVEELRKKTESEISIKEEKRIRTNPEQKLYIPIREYLEKTFSEIYKENVKFYDTSSFYLNKFILENNLYDEFEYYEEYKIKPDLVGFILSSKKIIIAEIKANELSLKDLGQLIGYCLVSIPEFAILISKEEPSLNLKKILKLNKKVLFYNNKEIKISRWDGKELKTFNI